MKEMPTDDPLFGKGSIRPDGRKIHDMYLFEVKQPSEIEGRLGLLQAASPRSRPSRLSGRSSEGGCSLVKS